MTHHIRTIAILVTVLAACGTGIGCKSNGGPWYKKSSYHYYNPFRMPHPDSEYGEDRFADTDRPSLNTHANVEAPLGGYTQPGSVTTVASTPDMGGGVSNSSYHPSQVPLSPYSPANYNAMQASAAGNQFPQTPMQQGQPATVAGGSYPMTTPGGYSTPDGGIESSYPQVAMSQQAGSYPQNSYPQGSYPQAAATTPGYPAQNYPQSGYPQSQPAATTTQPMQGGYPAMATPDQTQHSYMNGANYAAPQTPQATPAASPFDSAYPATASPNDLYQYRPTTGTYPN